MDDTICILCYKRPTGVEHDAPRKTTLVQCPRCGTYKIDGDAWASVDRLTNNGSHRHLLSAATRAAFDRGDCIFLTTDSIPEIVRAVRRPRQVMDGLDQLLLWIADRTESAAEYVRLDTDLDYPILSARDASELRFFVDKAKDLKLIERPSGNRVRLDIAGWERVRDIEQKRVRSDQAFVAMWFDSSMAAVYEDGFAPALRHMGYNPIRVDQVEHNDKIDDVILAEIRRSGLVVADFTRHRAGVYFEAGFAMGLGIPVVRACRADDIANTHFDTRQYNHIVWSDANDLRAKLIARIEATVGRFHPSPKQASMDT